jgi:hypothetical protein
LAQQFAKPGTLDSSFVENEIPLSTRLRGERVEVRGAGDKRYRIYEIMKFRTKFRDHKWLLLADNVSAVALSHH